MVKFETNDYIHEDLILCKDSAHKKSKSTLAPPGLYTGFFQILAHGSARARFVIVPSPSTSRTWARIEHEKIVRV